MLSPGGEVEGRSEWGELAIGSRELYGGFVRELEEASGFAIDYQECGAIDLAYSAEELLALEERAQAQASAGIESKAVSADQIKAFWPRIRSEELAGGRFFPKDAIVDPREVMLSLATACRKLDVGIEQNCAVLKVSVTQDGIRLHTTVGDCNYEAAVIAAGAWSSGIAVEGVPPIPAAEPVKGHLIGYQQPSQVCNTIIRHGETYLLQRANGLLIIGTSVEHAGFARELQPEIVKSLRERAAFLLPHLGETTPAEAWIGFRPASDRPHIEAWHSDRLYLAYGHYRNGILLAPVTAKKIAAQINANLRMQ